MPRPCAVEVRVRRYKESLAGDCGCNGLAPWRFTFAATKKVSRGIADATALRRGGSRSPLKKPQAIENVSRGIADATALRRGASRSRLQRTSREGLRMPRPCAVELHVRSYKERLAGDCGIFREVARGVVAASVRLHGAR